MTQKVRSKATTADGQEMFVLTRTYDDQLVLDQEFEQQYIHYSKVFRSSTFIDNLKVLIRDDGYNIEFEQRLTNPPKVKKYRMEFVLSPVKSKWSKLLNQFKISGQ